MPASVEELRFLYDATTHLNSTQVASIKDQMSISDKDMLRISGFKKETEFEIIVYLLGWTEKIIAFDESTSSMNDITTVDFLIDTIQGKKLAVEIKSSIKPCIRISPTLISKKKKVAEELNHELYFAINLMGHWMLFDENYLMKRDGKISLQEDYMNSCFENLLGERIFLFPKNIEILSIYSSTKVGLNINHDKYGNLIRYSIKFQSNRLYNITAHHKDNLFISHVLENLQDVMSSQLQKIQILDSDRTLIIEKLKSNAFLKLSAFLLAPIKHMINEKFNEGYTLEQFKELLKNDKSYKNNVNRKLILSVLSELDRKGYPIVMFLDRKGYRINDLYEVR